MEDTSTAVTQPCAQEDLQTRLTRLMLRIMVLGSFSVIAISVVAIPAELVSDWNDVAFLLLSSSIVLASSVILDLFLDRIDSEYIVLIIISGILCLIVFTESPYQISHGRTLLIFSVPIVMAAFLVRPWTAILVAIASSAIISVMSFLAGLVLPNIPAIVAFNMLALLVWKISSHLERTINMLSNSQDQLETQRNQAMVYLDILSHDVANDLQGILLTLEFLEAQSGEKNTRLVVENAIGRLRESTRLIREAQKLDSVSEGELKPLELNRELTICLDDFRSEYPEVSVESDLSAPRAIVRADMHLADLFRILLENAVQHNTRSEKKVWVDICEANNGYEVSIADNGMGISDRRKSTLFDLTRRNTGLGLHLAKLIVEKYGGRIEVRDRVNDTHERGAKFQVWFPKLDVDDQEIIE